MIKRQRVCVYCKMVGIETTFDTGNQLKQHVRQRHPRTAAQKSGDRKKLKEFRREQIILLSKLGLS